MKTALVEHLAGSSSGLSWLGQSGENPAHPLCGDFADTAEFVDDHMQIRRSDGIGWTLDSMTGVPTKRVGPRTTPDDKRMGDTRTSNFTESDSTKVVGYEASTLGIDKQTGAQLWAVHGLAAKNFKSSEIVLVQGFDFDLAAVKIDTGNTIWSTPNTGGLKHYEILGDYVVTHTYSNVHCLDIRSGYLMWTMDFPAVEFDSSAEFPHYPVVITSSNRVGNLCLWQVPTLLIGIDLFTGKPVWHVPIDEQPIEAVTCTSDLIVESYGTGLRGRSRISGICQWNVEFDSPIFEAVSMNLGRRDQGSAESVVCLLVSGELECVEVASGITLWRRKFGPMSYFELLDQCLSRVHQTEHVLIFHSTHNIYGFDLAIANT